MNNVEDTFIIRKATADDVTALAALHVVTFNETHGGFDSPTFATRKWQWQNIFQNQNDSWFCFVIENDKEGLVGFAKGQLYNHPDQPGYAGELNKIYLLRKYQKLGLGRRIICEVAAEFIKCGVNSMLLFGDANNRSNGFYENMGAEKLIGKNGEFHGGYGWTDLRSLSANCSGFKKNV